MHKDNTIHNTAEIDHKKIYALLSDINFIDDYVHKNYPFDELPLGMWYSFRESIALLVMELPSNVKTLILCGYQLNREDIYYEDTPGGSKRIEARVKAVPEDFEKDDSTWNSNDLFNFLDNHY